MKNANKAILSDENILRDMVDIATLQALLEAFGQISGMAAAMYTPGGTMICEPAHQVSFCDIIHKTKEGTRQCVQSDKGKIDEIRTGARIKGTECHAGLIDFCQPIFSRVAGKRILIGIFFAGQVLYTEDDITTRSIHRLKKLASDCKLDIEELLARYIQVPRLPRKRVEEIRAWMKQFSNLIGLLVERKAAAQHLLLDAIQSANDPNAIVGAIQHHLQPSAVSIFLQRDDVPAKFMDRIFLVATTFKLLVSRLALEFEENNIEEISYQSGEGFTGWVHKTGKVLHIRDVWDPGYYPKSPFLPRWKHKIQEVAKLEDTKEFLGVPVRSDEGKVIGVIRAVRLKDHHGFRNDEVELLTGVASVVGAAITKAQLYKKHAEKVEALNQAQALLNTLTEPDTNLDSITSSMVQALGNTYVTNGRWEAVYVLQHLKSSKQFRFVATFPPNLRKEFRGEPFPDTRGVSGHILYKTRKTFASTNCANDKVRPTTPWTSVVCAPIFHKNEMWGAVSICCERELSQDDVDLATPKITQFANDMSLVCRLSEILDAKNTAALIASNVLSLNLEAHEVYKSLEASQITAYHLCKQVVGEEKGIAEDLAKEIDESLSWADVCLDLGRYIKLCQIEPDTAIATFRDRHTAPKKDRKTYTPGYPWQEVDITKVAQKALNSVQGLIGELETDVKADIMDAGVIVGDENLLYRAFRNLLENAIVHGSRIPGKAVRFRKGLKVSFSVTRDSSTGINKIVMRDDGVGMNPKILAASREIYADPTLLRSTSLLPGFGTTIVAFAISVHLGSIAIESELNEGTRVYIQIPSDKKIRRTK